MFSKAFDHSLSIKVNLFFRCIISDAMCFLGLLGLFLMVILNELAFTGLQDERELFMWLIQSIITLTTVILLSLLIHYHYLKLSFLSVHRSVHHWRFGLTRGKLYVILVELIVCAIHPFPRCLPFHSSNASSNRTLFASNKTDSSMGLSTISFNVAFGLPSKSSGNQPLIFIPFDRSVSI